MGKPSRSPSRAEPSLAGARAAVLEAARRMESPAAQSLDGCGLLLEKAITCMNVFRCEWSAEKPPDFQARRQQEFDEVLKLRRGLLHIRRLLDNAAEFYQKWARRRAELSMGYTAAGEPAQVNQGGRMVVRG